MRIKKKSGTIELILKGFFHSGNISLALLTVWPQSMFNAGADYDILIRR